MITVTDAAPGSEQWLAARKGGITATEISALLGENPWQTPLTVWEGKQGIAEPITVSQAMEIGTMLEPTVIRLAEQRHGPINTPGHGLPSVVGWSGDPRWRASLDGIDQAGHPVEAKVTGQYWYEPPAHYVSQVQWQCGVVGAEFGTLAVLRGTEYTEHHIRFDPEWWEFARTVAEDWWQRHMVEGERPDASAGDDMSRLYTPDLDAVAEVPSDQWRDYMDLRDIEAQAREARIAAEAALQAGVGDATAVTVDGEQVATWRPTKGRKTIDRKALAAAGLLDQFQATGEPGRSWRVR